MTDLLLTTTLSMMFGFGFAVADHDWMAAFWFTLAAIVALLDYVDLPGGEQ